MKPYNDTANLNENDLNAWIDANVKPGSVISYDEQSPRSWRQTPHQVIGRSTDPYGNVYFWVRDIRDAPMPPFTIEIHEVGVDEDTWIPGYDPDQRWGCYVDAADVTYLDDLNEDYVLRPWRANEHPAGVLAEGTGWEAYIDGSWRVVHRNPKMSDIACLITGDRRVQVNRALNTKSEVVYFAMYAVKGDESWRTVPATLASEESAIRLARMFADGKPPEALLSGASGLTYWWGEIKNAPVKIPETMPKHQWVEMDQSVKVFLT